MFGLHTVSGFDFNMEIYDFKIIKLYVGLIRSKWFTIMVNIYPYSK